MHKNKTIRIITIFGLTALLLFTGCGKVRQSTGRNDSPPVQIEQPSPDQLENKTLRDICYEPLEESQKKYFIGESLNTANIVIVAEYEDENGVISTADITVQCDIYVDGDMNTAGKYIVKAKYGETEIELFEITVINASVQSLSASYTSIVDIYTNTPLQDLKNGLKITAYYDDNSERLLNDAEYELSSILNIGKNTITVTHAASGKTTTFEINVIEAAISNITISNPPAITSYIIGQAISTEDMKVSVNYSNNTSQTTTNYMISPATADEVTNNLIVVVTLKNTSITTSFTVSVNPAIPTEDNASMIVSKDYGARSTGGDTSPVSAGTISSGMIDTKGLMAHRYGRLDIEARLPSITTGLTPAFYMRGANNKNYPESGEIDILNMWDNSEISSGLWWGTGLTAYGIDNSRSDINVSASYHTYTLIWNADTLAIYVDYDTNRKELLTQRMASGNITGHIHKADNDVWIESAQIDFQQGKYFKDWPYYLILNMAVNGTNANSIAALNAANNYEIKTYIKSVKLFNASGNIEWQLGETNWTAVNSTPAAGELQNYRAANVAIENNELVITTRREFGAFVSNNAASTKLTYTEGEQFSPVGIVVTEKYNSFPGHLVTINNYVISTPNMTAGARTVTINYTSRGVSRSATFNITVNPAAKILQGISIAKYPNTTTNYLAGDLITTNGLTLSLNYGTGYPVETANIGFTISPTYNDLNVADAIRIITVNYEDKAATFGIRVSNNNRAVLRTITAGSSKVTYNSGELLDIGSIKVTGNYGNSTTNISTRRLIYGWTVTPSVINGSYGSTQRVTVNFRAFTNTALTASSNYTATFDVTIPPLAVISLSVQRPTKATYNYGETLVTTDMRVTLNYENWPSEATNNYVVGPMLLNTTPTQMITVTSNGKTATFNVTVNAVNTLTAVVTPSGKIFNVGDAITTSNFIVTANYVNGGGSTKVTGFTVSPSIVSTTPTQAVKIAYGAASVNVTITVNVPIPPDPGTMAVKTFAEDMTNFLNPEKGWWLINLTNQVSNSSVRVTSNHTNIILLEANIGDFKTGAISPAKLTEIQNALDIIRNNGLTVIFRAAYDFSGVSNPEPSLNIIEQHINQLKTIFDKNQDIIYIVQAGFLGPWGEWHSSVYGSIITANVQKQVANWMLDVVPAGSFVQFRRPVYVRTIFDNETLNDSKAFQFNTVPLSRAGWFNDGFLTTNNDYGTYSDSKYNRAAELTWSDNHCKYTPFVAESNELTSLSDPSNAVYEMEKLHAQSLNQSYIQSVISKWKNTTYGEYGNGSTFDYITHRFGYNFVLHKVTYNAEVQKGQPLQIQFEIENNGFGNLLKQKDFEVILTQTGKAPVTINVTNQLKDGDPRKWYREKGRIIENISVTVPSNFTAGTCTVNFRIAPPQNNPVFSQIKDKPAYCIRLASTYNGTTIWKSAGYNEVCTVNVTN